MFHVSCVSSLIKIRLFLWWVQMIFNLFLRIEIQELRRMKTDKNEWCAKSDSLCLLYCDWLNSEKLRGFINHHSDCCFRFAKKKKNKTNQANLTSIWLAQLFEDFIRFEKYRRGEGCDVCIKITMTSMFRRNCYRLSKIVSI